jgi:serine phosphatase RsbU (regulator of sigma subunit)
MILILLDIMMPEMGGDLADYFLIGKDLIVTLLGDVSGKGAGAALMMARTQALFRALSLKAITIGRVSSNFEPAMNCSSSPMA